MTLLWWYLSIGAVISAVMLGSILLSPDPYLVRWWNESTDDTGTPWTLGFVRRCLVEVIAFAVIVFLTMPFLALASLTCTARDIVAVWRERRDATHR